MVYSPIQRHPALQPFSRDHYAGLVAAHRLIRSGAGDDRERRAALAHFLDAWHSEIRLHFDDEERLLLPLITEPLALQRLLDDHAALREAARHAETYAEHRHAPPDAAVLRDLGEKLELHIRWEERVLFKEIEAEATPDQLADLQRQTHAFEQTRPRAASRE